VAIRATNELDREFLASRDPSFRPVGLEIGPDGALYLLDMQRDVIEHPDYIPDKVKAKLDLRAGSDRGRIWRITPKGGLPATKPVLRDFKAAELVTQLGSPLGWSRLTAQRLLIERGTTGMADDIRQLSQNGADPAIRVQALWTLHGLGVLHEGDVRRALSDGNAGVRENALRLANGFLPATDTLHAPVIALAHDESPRVRFQCAQTLGLLGTIPAVGGLFEIYRNDAEHRWTRLAVISSLRPKDTRYVLNRLLPFDRFRLATLDGPFAALSDLAELIGARAAIVPDDISWLVLKVDSFLNEQSRLAVLQGLLTGLERSGATRKLSSLAGQHLNRLSLGASTEEMRLTWQLSRRFGLPENERQRRALIEAGQAATNTAGPLPGRLAAIRLMALGSPTLVKNILMDLLDGRQPAEVQSNALTALVTFKEATIGGQLVARWRSYAPAMRSQVVATLLGHRPYHEPLLMALETGKITVGELSLDLEQRRRLLREGTPDVRSRAAKFFGDEEYSNRKSVVTEWLTKLPSEGNAIQGRRIFEATCARCHSCNGVGFKVGPELSGVAHRSVEDLISNILDPNMAINPGFVAYTAETKDGETQTGLLVGETTESVVLLQALGLKLVIPRAQLLKLESSGQSLMPEGLEAGKSPQDLRDLVAFLQESH
jgi:putative heme-binding domain-containing protein